MADINKAIKGVLNTGTVTMGVKETKKASAKRKLKMVIVASNFPEKEFGKAPVHVFKGTNVELGTVCGKPFAVSVLGILDEGQSGIISIGKSSR
ncbi:MAG: 50S ribosomal protein L30e [Thermoplasmata archaeon]|nr:50S ribosomal protein L30e [Thermoplasmata archaeon]